MKVCIEGRLSDFNTELYCTYFKALLQRTEWLLNQSKHPHLPKDNASAEDALTELIRHLLTVNSAVLLEQSPHLKVHSTAGEQ